MSYIVFIYVVQVRITLSYIVLYCIVSDSIVTYSPVDSNEKG